MRQKSKILRQYAENISIANGAVTLAFFALYVSGPFGNPIANTLFSTLGICCFVGWANVLVVRAANSGALRALKRLRNTDVNIELTSLAPNPDNSPTPPRNPSIDLIANALRADDANSAETLRTLLRKRGETLDQVAAHYTLAGTESTARVNRHELVAYTNLAFVFLSGMAQVYASTLSAEEKKSSAPWIMTCAVTFALSFGLSSLYTIMVSRKIARLETEADSVNHLLTKTICAAQQKKIRDLSEALQLKTTGGSPIINPLLSSNQTSTAASAGFFSSSAPVQINNSTVTMTIIMPPKTPPILPANSDDPSAVAGLNLG